MNMLSLFSGIGGIDLAAQWAGMETVAFVEIDPFCRAVLKKHWPDVAQFEDICDVTAESLSGLGRIDLIVGGFPCQDVSLAGARAGLDGHRSTLWFEFARLIREIKPRWVLGENVPGLLSANSGEFMSRILRDLAVLGYDAAWGVWGAGDVGAGHKRERVFIVAHDARLGGGWARERVGAAGEVGDSPLRGCGMRGGKGRTSSRDGSQGVADALHGGRRGGQGVEGEGSTGRRRAGEDCEELADAEGIGKRAGLCTDGARGERGRRSGDEDSTGAAGQSQSRLGGAVDGLSAGLVCDRVHPAVAGPGQAQYPHEPPRIASGVKNRARQLKALGNAVDPYQIYPLLAAIAEADSRC